MTWDEKFMSLARHIALWSKDRSRKVGAIITGSDHEILSAGYNGFPRGVNDDIEERHQRPAKYKWTEHAERNAIYNAARALLKGTTIHLPWYPCVDCARAIIQVGISEIICLEPDWNDPMWADDFAVVPVMLKEAGVKTRFVGKSDLIMK
jgi:dCMP deaminase